MPSAPSTLWWQTAVIYQVYPRSFEDTNADGIGDLPGITSRLDYLAQLGVEAVWISPFYPSPMADFGYDVSDYTGVDPIFGTLADFDALIARAHSLGLKLILDFVPNHSSNQHPWFHESRKSRESAKRDWYIWRDPAPGNGPPELRLPNNWLSHFGGPAWTFDPVTQQFYLHSFLPQQPDLNWRNPAVHEAIFNALRFWLDKGVDGFRMDVLWLLIKDGQFRDNPPNPDWRPGQPSFGQFLPLYTADRPETHVIVAQMRALLKQYPGDRLLIGEIYLPIRELVRYYGSSAPEPATVGPNLPPTAIAPPTLTGAQLPFNFHLIQTPWRAPDIGRLIRDYEAALPPGAWPNYVLGNHDQSRLATRIGPAQARVAAMLLLTLRGTPTLYYGDELGMTDANIPPELVQDPAEKNQPGLGLGRDPERTPMLWDSSTNAGFSSIQPWLPIGPVNTPAGPQPWTLHTVAAESGDPASILTLYRTLLSLRRAHPALHSGAISQVESLGDSVLSYTRTSASRTLQVFLNLTSTPQQIPNPRGRLLLSTDPARRQTNPAGTPTLAPNEGLLLALA